MNDLLAIKRAEDMCRSLAYTYNVFQASTGRRNR